MIKQIKLSFRAQKLWERVQDETNYYKAYSPDTPKAMQELIDAGLVGYMGRVTRMELCYVPTGSIGFKTETFPKKKKA